MDPLKRARSFYDEEIRRKLKTMDKLPVIRGFLATDDPPAHTYARFMRQAFGKYGIEFELKVLPANDLKKAIESANQNPNIHGIFVFYPIFGAEKDKALRNTVSHTKDIEGLTDYWLHKLYLNDRYIGKQKKALLPCTPLAVVKILEQCMAWDSQNNLPLEGKKVTVFNRSEVVGRPLAGMLSNDGAEVFSFDIDSVRVFRLGEAFPTTITRKEALAQSDIVVTGVPSSKFQLVSKAEIKKGTICVNFSSIPNFTKDIKEGASVFVPRIGPITVLMCVRNSLRLFKNFHSC